MSVLTLFALAVFSSCGREDPTEPLAPSATATPTAAQHPTPPPTPTPFAYEGHYCVLNDDIQQQLHRGQDFTLNVRMSGDPGVGPWSASSLGWAFFSDVVEPGTILTFEGATARAYGATGETGWSILVSGGQFQGGSRLSFSARFRVRATARLGYVLVGSEGDVWNPGMPDALPQIHRFFVEIVP